MKSIEQYHEDKMWVRELNMSHQNINFVPQMKFFKKYKFCITNDCFSKYNFVPQMKMFFA